MVIDAAAAYGNQLDPGPTCAVFSLHATKPLASGEGGVIGFIGDLQGSEVIDWKLLSTFTAFAVGGIFAGILLSKKIPGQKLKKGFGWFVLVMGIYIIIKELFFK